MLVGCALFLRKGSLQESCFLDTTVGCKRAWPADVGNYLRFTLLVIDLETGWDESIVDGPNPKRERERERERERDRNEERAWNFNFVAAMEAGPAGARECFRISILSVGRYIPCIPSLF